MRFVKPRIITSPLIIVLALILFAINGRSQQQELQRANEFYRAQNWTEAAKAYDSITREYPGNWQAWFFKAMSLHESGDYEKAVQSFEQAIKIRQQPRAMFMIARSYAKLGKTDAAFAWLTKAVDGGFADLPLLERDADLETLRREVRFKEIATKLTAIVRPCAVRPEFRHLDFFIGDWDLQIQGQSVQTTNVRVDLAGCIVLQDDSVQNGYQAKATHFFNAELGKWQQTYIDTRGAFALWTGEVKDGVLTYTREAVAGNGATISHRSTFTKIDADRIHQVYEQSKDGGKTWTTTFDAFYVRKQGKPEAAASLVVESEQVTFKTEDGIQVYADVFESPQGKTAPLVLLFHQGAANARGEYGSYIAPRLVKNGFNVISVDQRQGGDLFGQTNRTVAGLKGKEYHYCEAYPDLKATLEYAKQRGFNGKRFAWGSSYSATLVMRLASEHSNALSGVLAFSPAAGEPMRECQPGNYAPSVKVPTLVLRPASEMNREISKQQSQIFEKYKFQTYIASNGVHGSSMLHPERVVGTVEEHWKKVFDFLHSVAR